VSSDRIVQGFQQEGNLVSIRLPQGKYQVGDSTTIHIPHQGGEQIIDNDKIDEMFRVFDENKLSHYEHVETGETLKISEYIARKQAVDTKVWNETEEMEVWPSIKDRHAYELLTAMWKPIHTPTKILQKVEIHIAGEAPSTGNPFITPIRKLTGDLTNTLYMYARNAHIVSVVEEAFKKNGYRLLDQEPPSLGNPKDMEKTYWFKDGLEFSRMFPSKDAGSKYITIEIPSLDKYKKSVKQMSGTLAELEATFKLIDGEINSIMNAYFNKSKRLEDADAVTCGEVLSGLESLYRKIVAIDSMKKTQSEHSAARREAEALIKKFRKVFE
jgi:hypothetical protein